MKEKRKNLGVYNPSRLRSTVELNGRLVRQFSRGMKNHGPVREINAPLTLGSRPLAQAARSLGLMNAPLVQGEAPLSSAVGPPGLMTPPLTPAARPLGLITAPLVPAVAPLG